MADDEHNITFVGIDQALRKTGICFLKTSYNALTAIELGTLDTHSRKLKGPARLAYIRDWLHEQFVGKQIVMAALEQGAYRASGRVFQLGGVSALVQVSLYDHGIPYAIVRPDQLKTHFTHYANATKDQMVDRAREILGIEVTDDEADAFALARIAYDIHRNHADTRKEAKVICKIREEDRIYESPTTDRPNAFGLTPGG